jgi:hypothetical protein
MGQFKRLGGMRELTVALGEKDIEMERMKTTLVALTKKLNLVNEVQNYTQMYQDQIRLSEEQRHQLHQHFMDSSNKIKNEN